MISKFPPIQGGISSAAYWLVKGLAEKGVEVHLVTNAESVEDDYRIPECFPEKFLPENVFIHQAKQDIPWHIPFSPLYESTLLDTVLEVCSSNQIDLLDSWYLAPYGMVAFLASQLTGLPYICRHGGSDLSKFLNKGLLSRLLGQAVSSASAVVSNRAEIRALNRNTVDIPRYIPDERVFQLKPNLNSKETSFAYVGKVNYHWQYKGLEQILNFWQPHSTKSRLIFLSNGRGKKDFITKLRPKDVEFMDFIPPWQMPLFLKQVDYIFYLVRNNPLLDYSNLVLEAVACGVKILTDDCEAFSLYQPYFDVSSYVLDLREHIQFKPERSLTYPLRYNHQDYLAANLKLYHQVIP